MFGEVLILIVISEYFVLEVEGIDAFSFILNV
jgi:hypothetical protein